MRGLIILLTLFISFSSRADIQQRILFYTQQTDLLRQICFMPDGTFLQDRILFDQSGSIRETAMDCNAQALALEQEHNDITAFIESEQCPADLRIENEGLVDLLNGNAPVVEELACPGIRSASDCMNNLSCNLMRSIFPGGSLLARQFSNHPIFSSCDGTGSCLTNLGKAIWDNLWDSVKGMYNIGSAVLSWTGNKIASLWRAEDQTSNRGIAATEASDSELDKFVEHPLDYILNKGRQILNNINEGIKNRYGCAKWTGVPHLSECVQPMSMECADCNEKLNMICGIAGYLGANVISNFFTGGAAAAAQISVKVIASTTFRIARSVPGASRITAAMARGGNVARLGRVFGSVRSAWTAVSASRIVQGTLHAARRLRATGAAANGFARKNIFLYARGQDAIINAAKAYTRINLAAYMAGYRRTFAAAERTRLHLYSQFPRLADITAGRYANVSTPQQYLRESTKDMRATDRAHMRIAITLDANNQRRLVVYDDRAGTLNSDIRFNFSPQTGTTPTTVARSVASSDNVGETIVVTARRPLRVTNENLSSWSHLRGRSDQVIREWYVRQVSHSRITALNQRWINEGVSLRERAQRLYQIRHDSRLVARYHMADRSGVNRLRERDRRVYGNPDGPTFDYLVAEAREQGLDQNQAYQYIIDHVDDTNARANEMMNVEVPQ